MSIHRPRADSELIVSTLEAIQEPWFGRWFAGSKTGIEALDRDGNVLEENLEKIAKSLQIPVSIGNAKRIWRHRTLAARLKALAYDWLHPRRRRGFDHLPRLLGAYGLNHIPSEDLVKTLCAQLDEFAREHRDLERWVAVRKALLERSVFNASTVLGKFERILRMHRFSLMQLGIELGLAGPRALGFADKLTCDALEGATQVVSETLGSGLKAQLNASLMLAVSDPASVNAAITNNAATLQKNDQMAKDLWAGLPAQPVCYLMIVAETWKDRHSGFWVPHVSGDRSAVLPGAPEAYANGYGSAVFKGDLPELRGFSENLSKRWHAYILDVVPGTLFVSLPVLVPRINQEEPSIAAILNVNVSLANDGCWHRAYHPEWLLEASRVAQPFAEIALYATLAKLSLRLPVPPPGAGSPILLDNGVVGGTLLRDLGQIKLLQEARHETSAG